ncbi:glycerol-3-phosphate acyltransferase [Effusibacillus dendaii]|uniref:Glycerol-3-phosphate acyltransferase n=1 Tax=Effusibacillus dendaii TaxID=2743772 RepID=A0A7I8DBR5_9BACL|nr:glycerol-3-phosphate acyltransferase [Effusibacillus dendaii]
MLYFLAILLGYLLGSISFSYLIGRITMNIDIREHGSGNAGATNTLRVLGKKAAIFVLLGDVLKGVVAVWIGYLLTHSEEGLALAGLASIVGHNWPVYFGFRGGKGVATTIGVMISIVPTASLYAGIVAILILLITRMVSVFSLLFQTILPIAIWLSGAPSVYFWSSIVTAVLSYWRHRSNIVRILEGKESRIGKSK